MLQAAHKLASGSQTGRNLHLHRMHTALQQQQQRPCSIHRQQQQLGKQHRLCTVLQAYKLTASTGGELSVDQAKYLVGSGAAVDLKILGSNVAPEHAELLQKGKQVFLKALQGESVFDKTYTWIDDAEARPNVSYVLASGSKLAFGDQSCCYTVEFEEPSGANPLVEMMMKGMAASADPSVQKELSE